MSTFLVDAVLISGLVGAYTVAGIIASVVAVAAGMKAVELYGVIRRGR